MSQSINLKFSNTMSCTYQFSKDKKVLPVAGVMYQSIEPPSPPLARGRDGGGIDALLKKIVAQGGG